MIKSIHEFGPFEFEPCVYGYSSQQCHHLNPSPMSCFEKSISAAQSRNMTHTTPPILHPIIARPHLPRAVIPASLAPDLHTSSASMIHADLSPSHLPVSISPKAFPRILIEGQREGFFLCRQISALFPIGKVVKITMWELIDGRLIGISNSIYIYVCERSGEFFYPRLLTVEFLSSIIASNLQ